MITTKELRVALGQTVPLRMTFRDYKNALVDLTGGNVYLSLTADLKVPRLWVISSVGSPTSNGGIVIQDQTALKGQAIATILPAATKLLLPTGDDDPYFWDAWAVDAAGNTFPAIQTSRFVVLSAVSTF
jgi:hypothetical protein